MSEHRDLYELFQANKENRVRIFLNTGREVEGKIGSVSPASAPKLGYR
jgi:hypothetical protein